MATRATRARRGKPTAKAVQKRLARNPDGASGTSSTVRIQRERDKIHILEEEKAGLLTRLDNELEKYEAKYKDVASALESIQHLCVQAEVRTKYRRDLGAVRRPHRIVYF